MAYKSKEVIQMLRIFKELESKAKDFLFLSAFPMKNKEQKVKSATATLKAIEEYKKLPLEIRKEVEADKNNHVSKIEELEKLCKEAIKN